MEKALVQARKTKFLDASLVELFRGEYALAIRMLANKDIFSNWIKWRMCGDYCVINNCMCLDKYAMPLPQEIFDGLGQAKVFSTLDLIFGYHQLPLTEGDKVQMAFWRIDLHGKDCLQQWQFLPFGLKNAPTKFQRVMDQVLARLDITKCYINDIIIFSSTLEDHMHHLQEVFGRFKNHNFNLHLNKCQFLQTHVEYLGHMIYPCGGGIEGQG